MKTILKKNLLEPFSYINLKAVRSWCTDHDVLNTKKGKLEFVYETVLELAYKLPFITIKVIYL